VGSRLTELKYVILFRHVEALEGTSLYCCEMGMLIELRVVRGEGTAYSWGTLVGHQRGNIGISGIQRDINRLVAEHRWNNSGAPVGHNWGTNGKTMGQQREYGGIAVGKQWGTIGKLVRK
jgi:hypothetical protein